MKILDKRILALVGIVLLTLLFTTTTASAACGGCIGSMTIGYQRSPPPASYWTPGILTSGYGGTVYFPIDVARYPGTTTSFGINFTITSPSHPGIVTSFDYDSIYLMPSASARRIYLNVVVADWVPRGVYLFTIEGRTVGPDLDAKNVTARVVISPNIADIMHPAITWNESAAIDEGTPLGGGQLNAHSSVPGTFIYDPTFGTVLSAGNDQILRAYFIPEDIEHYSPEYKEVTIDVLNVVPTPTTTIPPGTVLRGSSFGTIGIVALIGCLVIIGISRLRMKKK